MCRFEEYLIIYWVKKKILFNILIDIVFLCNKVDIEFF